jgi:inosose dehydratase
LDRSNAPYHAGQSAVGTRRIGTAPISWGVTSATAGPSPNALLSAVCRSGHAGIELGPFGYFGEHVEIVSERLGRNGLSLAGAWVALSLADDDRFTAGLRELDRVAQIVGGVGSGPVLISDAGSPERERAAGRPNEVARAALGSEAFGKAVDRLRRAAELCRSYGTDVAFHPHVGTYVESQDELEALIDATSADEIGLCADTGHALVGGVNPADLPDMCGDRLVHLHVKDVDLDLLMAVRNGDMGFEDAWAEGIFCALDQGVVSAHVIAALVSAVPSSAWVVVEQDRAVVGSAELPCVEAEERASVARLTSLVSVYTNS